MTAKFTPGPWTCEYNNEVGPNDDSYWEFYDISSSDGSIGRIYREADARLISAAPDMLEALQNCVNQLANDRAILHAENEDIMEMPYALVQGRAAIAKALGEEP